MDENLQGRWQSGEAPFDQSIVIPDQLLPISTLRAALMTMVGRFENRYAGKPLMLLHDWHEHDGYITTGRQIAWGEIHSMLAADQSLYAARPGDTYVRLGIYPWDFGFYLRILLLEEEDKEDAFGDWGSFDLSCPRSEAVAVVTNLQGVTSGSFRIESAKAYFDTAYGG